VSSERKRERARARARRREIKELRKRVRKRGRREKKRGRDGLNFNWGALLGRDRENACAREIDRETKIKRLEREREREREREEWGRGGKRENFSPSLSMRV